MVNIFDPNSIAGSKLIDNSILQNHVSNGYLDLIVNQTVSGTKTFHRLKTSGDPIDGLDLATKSYVDAGDAGGGGLNDIVEDLTPELGGNLNVNGFDIIGELVRFKPTAGNNVEISLDLGGVFQLNGGNLDLNSQALTDGTGAAVLITPQAGADVSINLSVGGRLEMTGGNIDLNGNSLVDGGGNLSIIPTAGSNVELTLSVGGVLVVGGGPLNLDGQVLQIDGTQVLANQDGGWFAATGTTAKGGFDADSGSLSDALQSLAGLIDTLLNHGMIGA